MAYVDNGGTQVWWEEAGSGSETVLLVMGHAYDSRMWHRVVPALAPHYRVLTFDNRGVGRTKWDGKPFSLNDLASDGLAVMTAAGVDRAHVYGASMGGATAQAIALDAPERTLTLILGCTGTLSPDVPTPPRNRRAELLVRFVPRRLLVRGTPTSHYGVGTPPDVIAEDLAIIKSTKGSARGRLAQGYAIAGFRSRDRLKDLRVSTLVLHGDDDNVVPYAMGEELASLIPGAELVTLPGAGHNYLTSVDSEGNKVVLDFLSRAARS